MPAVSSAPARAPRITAVRRQEERVLPLELFFDLVFVLCLTQCTALMATNPTWEGLGQGLLILCLIWWAWVGYAWLTSVIDPEEGVVRIVIFTSMAAFLVLALCVPDAFGDDAVIFACAYGIVRAAHIALFLIASRDDPELRRSVLGLGGGTAVGVGLLLAGAIAGGETQTVLWILSFVLDMAEPAFFGAAGWRLMPSHFAERHGLIVLIAIGESIVAIGAGAETQIDAGVITAAVLGIVVAAALWWLYFDVVATAAEHRLSRATPGREQNEIARDSYSFLHFPMVAGIVLIALGMKKTLGEVGEPLKAETAVAILGGTSLYLIGHVAFRLRNIRTLNVQRLVCAGVLLALVPVAVAVDALVTVAMIAALLTAVITYETLRFAELRDRIRHQLAREPG